MSHMTDTASPTKKRPVGTNLTGEKPRRGGLCVLDPPRLVPTPLRPYFFPLWLDKWREFRAATQNRIWPSRPHEHRWVSMNIAAHYAMRGLNLFARVTDDCISSVPSVARPQILCHFPRPQVPCRAIHSRRSHHSHRSHHSRHSHRNKTRNRSPRNRRNRHTHKRLFSRKRRRNSTGRLSQ